MALTVNEEETHAAVFTPSVGVTGSTVFAWTLGTRSVSFEYAVALFASFTFVGRTVSAIRISTGCALSVFRVISFHTVYACPVVVACFAADG